MTGAACLLLTMQISFTLMLLHLKHLDAVYHHVSLQEINIVLITVNYMKQQEMNFTPPLLFIMDSCMSCLSGSLHFSLLKPLISGLLNSALLMELKPSENKLNCEVGWLTGL